jgi:FkbM family methyltransferase
MTNATSGWRRQSATRGFPSSRARKSGRTGGPTCRLRDCVHYLQPPLQGAVKLRARVLNRLRTDFQFEADLPRLGDALLSIPDDHVRRLDDVLTLAEQRLPTDPLFDHFLEQHAPDVLLLSPVVHFGPAQVDLIASAHRLGIPAWMLLYSWDNLSTKGALHRWPDRMFVWNEQQRREAETLHGFPSERVTVVGAPRFDEFFALQPGMTREQFLEPLGLDATKLTLLYVCSSRFVSESELPFVRRWLTALRESGLEHIHTCNIIVRPHPDIALLPPGTALPRHRWEARPELIARIARPFEDERAIVLTTPNDTPRGLFESIVHSDAVVGLNTTAEIEAGIAGRPVFTVLADTELADGQSTTVHFHYLRKEHGGFVTTASSLKEHVTQLGAALSRTADSRAIRAFIESFVRPLGFDRAVSPLYAEALENAYGERAQDASQRAGSVVSASDELDRVRRATDRPVLSLGGSATDLQVYASAIADERASDGIVRLEAGVVRWIDNYFDIGDVLYEIGAGIGEYAIVAAKRKASTVIGFEAAYTAHKEFCDNVLLNRCEALVVPVPLALAARDGLAEIKYLQGHPGEPGYLVVEERSWRVKHRGPNKPYLQPACVMRLDTFMNQQQSPTPHHIHIAAGLNALAVLEGARQILRLTSLKSVYLTVSAECVESVSAAMSTAGLALNSHVVNAEGVQLLFARAAR